MTVLTLTSNTTVAEVDIGTNNQYCDYDLYSTGSGAPYTLNVTGNFSFDGTWMADYIQPVLNIGGTFTVGSTGYWDWRPSVKLGSSSGYTNGDTFAGGISQYCGYTLDASGNNETFGGKLMSQGFVPSMGEWDYHGSILGYIKIGGTGETFNAGTSFDLEYGGTIWLSTAQTLTNVSTITFNGGAAAGRRQHVRDAQRRLRRRQRQYPADRQRHQPGVGHQRHHAGRGVQLRLSGGLCVEFGWQLHHPADHAGGQRRVLRDLVAI